VELRATKRPRKVLLDGVKAAFAYDEDRQLCRVAVPERPVAKGFELLFDASEADAKLASATAFLERAFGSSSKPSGAEIARLKAAKPKKIAWELIRLAGAGPLLKNEAPNLVGSNVKLKFHFNELVDGSSVEALYQRKEKGQWKTLQTLAVSASASPAELPYFNDGDFGAKMEFQKPSRILFKFKYGGHPVELPFEL
jgi:hypothetical protein